MPSSVGNRPWVSTDLERVLLRALDRGEEVRLVLDDRPAERCRRTGSGGSPACRLSLVFSVSVLAFIDVSRNSVKKLPRRSLVPLLVTMFITPPLLRPYLGLGALGDEVELLDRFEREQLQQAADGVVVVVAAVDLVVHVAAVAAVDLRRVLRALGRVGVEAEADAGNRRREVGELAAVERQALDAADVDDAADRRGPSFQSAATAPVTVTVSATLATFSAKST